MNIDSCIDQLTQRGINFDGDLLVSITMALAARRHIAISSKSPEDTISEIGAILKMCYQFEDGKEIQGFRFGPESDFNRDFVDIIRTDSELHLVQPKVLIVSGIELTKKKEFHRRLHASIKLRSIANASNQNYRFHDDFFSILFVVRDTTPPDMDRQLLNDIWFEQAHSTSEFQPEKQPAGPLQLSLRDGIDSVRDKASKITLIREIQTYIYDIIIFTRTHRFVIAGIPTFVLKDYVAFVKFYAAINGYDYVIPEMVKMAAYKLLPMRIQMLENPLDEPSVMYGSDPGLVRQILAKVDVGIIVEDIVNKVQPPV